MLESVLVDKFQDNRNATSKRINAASTSFMIQSLGNVREWKHSTAPVDRGGLRRRRIGVPWLGILVRDPRDSSEWLRI